MSKPETPCRWGCLPVGYRCSHYLDLPAPQAEAPPKDVSPGSAWQREAEANGASLLPEAPPAPKRIPGVDAPCNWRRAESNGRTCTYQFCGCGGQPAPPANVSEGPKRVPLEWGVMDAASAMCLIAEARAERDALKARLDALPADWSKDSSLKTWFPITAQELDKLAEAALVSRAELERLRENVGVKYGATGMCQDRHRMVMFPDAGGWGENCPMCDARAAREAKK